MATSPNKATKSTATPIGELSYEVETLNFGEITTPYVPKKGSETDKRAMLDEIEVEPYTTRESITLRIYPDGTGELEIGIKTPRQTIAYPTDPTLANPTVPVAKIIVKEGITQTFGANGKLLSTVKGEDNTKELYNSYATFIINAKKSGVTSRDICGEWFNMHAGAIQGDRAQLIIKGANETDDEKVEGGVITVAETAVPADDNANPDWQSASTMPVLAKVVSHIQQNTMRVIANIYLDAANEIFGFTDYEFGADGNVKTIQTTTYETSPTTAKFTNNNIRNFEVVECKIN